MVLRLPSNVSAVSKLAPMSGMPFPPRGFAAFEDHSLGNGDTFGLYWPIGREDQDPLVVEILHDEWAVVPAFSSLDAFIKSTAELDEAEHADWPSFAGDERSPHACFTTARESIASGRVDEAYVLLQSAIGRLPEYTAALSLLSTQCVRLGKHDEACRYAVRAVRSPPSFGRGVDTKKTWGWIARQSRGPDDLANDPIWIARNGLAVPPSGGSKQNDVYLVLAEAAAGYSARDEIIEALSLWQAYAEFMSGETVSFRERYGFTAQVHQERQRALEERLSTGARELSR